MNIGIASREYIHQRMKNIASGTVKPKQSDPRVWFTSYEALARVFSKQNMALIEILRHAEPESVTELAKLVGREKTNVLRSLKILAQFEIVDFEDGEKGRKAPKLNYDDFRVENQSDFRSDKAA